MSSTTASASSSSSQSTNTDPVNWVGNPNGGGSTNSTLYLFTFLVVLIILAVISAALLFRAYFIKRRFRRRIQEAIANGQALPPDALAGLGIHTARATKGEPKVGPMPILWEAEMYKDEIEEDGSRRASMISKDATRVTEKEVDWSRESSDDWRDFTPVGMIHFPTGVPRPPPPPVPEPIIPQMSETMPRRQLLRSLFRPDRSDPLEYIRQAELARANAQNAIDEHRTTFEVPEQGSEVVMGVMIAFPTEEGTGSDRWSLTSGGIDEEQQVPDVCLGIMEATIGEERER